MYLVKVGVYKQKDDRLSCVDIPAFFRYDNSIEEVREYISKSFKEVATLYIEQLPEPDPDDPQGLSC